MEKSIQEQKAAGITNVVIDKNTFISHYWSYSSWENPKENPNEWPNDMYAKYYGIDSLSAK